MIFQFGQLFYKITGRFIQQRTTYGHIVKFIKLPGVLHFERKSLICLLYRIGFNLLILFVNLLCQLIILLLCESVDCKEIITATEIECTSARKCC